MTYDTILILLGCVIDFNNLSDDQIFNELEYIDENMDELLFTQNIVEPVHADLKSLHKDISNFMLKGNNVQRVKMKSENWDSIKKRATLILKTLKVEIITPDEFMDKYDWEDGEQWDMKTGTINNL